MGKLKLKIATVVTGHPSARKIEIKDRRGREGGTAIFSELKIADFPGLCVASLTVSTERKYTSTLAAKPSTRNRGRLEEKQEVRHTHH